MKHLAELLQFLLVTTVAAIFMACVPVPEKPPQNDFFAPVDLVIHKNAKSDTLVVLHGSDSTHVNDSLKDSLIVLFRQQNKRLIDMIQQLNTLTKKNNMGDLMGADNIGEIPTNLSRLTNEVLLEKIKNQNQRLNDVIEHLKLISQNQNENHYNLVTGANVVPVLITSAKAAPVQPTQSRPVVVPRNLNISLNYGMAIQLYKSRQYGKAIDVFEKLLNQKIEPKLADRYHFWMGVCYLNLNKSNQAIKEFTDVLRYTNSNKAEEAYFMIGQCYERTGAKKSAILTYEKMLRIYPSGNLKQNAEKKLALLK